MFTGRRAEKERRRLSHLQNPMFGSNQLQHDKPDLDMYSPSFLILWTEKCSSVKVYLSM